MNRSFHCIALFLLMLAGIVTQSPAQQMPIANPVLFDINKLVVNGEGAWSWCGSFTSLGNELILAATDGMSTSLYGIDATAASPSPRRIKDFYFMANEPAYAGTPRNVNGTVYLSAAPSVAVGMELFKSDGTTAGTVLVRDLLTSTKVPHSNPSYYHMLGNGKVIFTAAWGFWESFPWKSYYVSIYGLFVTNGTSSGTSGLTTNKAFQSHGSHKIALTVHNGTAYCFLKDYVAVKKGAPSTKFGEELWKSDGTAAGTVMVKDINPGTGSGCVPAISGNWPLAYDANRIVSVGDYIYFTATDGSSGYELWKSDGTSVGTTRVMDIFPGAESSLPAWLTVMNNIVYFSGRTANDGDKLMRYIPATNTVDVVADIHPGTGPRDSAYVSWITAIDGTLYFSAFDPEHGQELWKSDGIPVALGGNTVRVADINPGVHGSYPNISWPGAMTLDVHSENEHCFFSHNGWLYFPADDGVHGIELWRSNGTTTQLLTDINTDPTFNIGSSDIPYTMCVVNNKLFFHGYDKPYGWEPYMIDLATLPKSAGERQAAPTSLALEQNYPNPFGSASMQSTAITFSLPESALVRISIHDMLGREVAVVVEGVRPAGTQSISFNASLLPAGSYVCRLEAQGAMRTRMMHIVR
ncbi:MAG: T9SS type A sorting domain-containing protein [Bacteroidia bacterium]|nr:T9SS type A sorting domain-containing protein [Bacteroidia bacterium]